MQPASGLRGDFVGGLQPSPQNFEAGGWRENLTLTAVEADRLPRRLSGGGILHAASGVPLGAQLRRRAVEKGADANRNRQGTEVLQRFLSVRPGGWCRTPLNSSGTIEGGHPL